MDAAGVIERVERISAACDAPPSGHEIGVVEAGLVAVRELTAWADGRHSILTSRLRATSSFPEAAIAEASKLSLGAASKLCDHADTLDATPKLAEALDDGAIPSSMSTP